VITSALWAAPGEVVPKQCSIEAFKIDILKVAEDNQVEYGYVLTT
jgi:hypothetical protein